MATVVDRTLRRTAKVRRNIRRAAGGRARLSVFRSSKHIYAQVIDDIKGETLASASSLEKTMREGKKTGANIDAAKAVGKLLAERAAAKGVKEVVFDRGGYLFHGRVKALAVAARVVVGDEKGRVGFGHGKAREVPEAIRKATEAAKRSLIRVPLCEGRTLHHDVAGRHGAGRVFLRSAPPGTGIIAGGPMRAVFETLGMQDVVAKSLGSSNPYNMVRATFDALKHQDSPRSVAARRNVKVSALQARRREPGESEQAAD